MKEETAVIREMTMEDYAGVRQLWMGIRGFAIRSIDDSAEGVARFIRRNPSTSMVAVVDGEVVGAILCGHDGRRACLYHVCVKEGHRKLGIGQQMVEACLSALKEEHVNKVNLIAFQNNEVGNRFWQELGWTFREDINYYEFVLNQENRTHCNP